MNAPGTAGTESHTYAQILKSTALIGGSSLITIGFGVLRTKAMAQFLGPAGLGLMALFSSIVDLTQMLAGVGVNSSGVRQIAEAVGSGRPSRIAATAVVLKRVSVLLGVIGGGLLVVFAEQVSMFTFDTNQKAPAVALLSLAVFCGLVAAGQAALIQGTRRVSDLARMNVIAASCGTAVSIPIVYVLRQNGIVPSLIAVAFVTMLTSWWLSRRIDIDTPSISAAETLTTARGLLELGLAFMVSGVMVMGSAYAVRVILAHKVGVEATGLYQSAWTLGGLYIGFILRAMGADFYPRLTASASNNAACNRLVNEQMYVGLLIGGPGAIATLTFAPVVIAAFYTPEFGHAAETLRWICLGVAIRVITWPMGFILLAKGRSGLFVASDVAWTIVNLSATWAAVSYFGLAGAGIAFFISYVFHACLTYPLVRYVSGFSWSRENTITTVCFLCVIGVIFCVCQVMPGAMATIAGTVCVGACAAYSFRTLVNLVSVDRVPSGVRRALGRLGSAASSRTGVL